jgi:OFA family oxalate/formate antiporter-like MFS transporter
MIKASTGCLHMVFLLTTIMNLVVVGLALFVLKPMRSKIVASESAKLAHAV